MLGSTRLITNSAGDAAGAMCYTAFGIALVPDGILNSEDEPVGGIATRFAWCGAWGYETDDLVNPSSDDDFGMIHIGARWYDPTIGRFLQRDPIGLRGGTNVYTYALDVPVIAVDPTGHMSGVSTAITVVVVGAILMLGIDLVHEFAIEPMLEQNAENMVMLEMRNDSLEGEPTVGFVRDISARFRRSSDIENVCYYKDSDNVFVLNWDYKGKLHKKVWRR